MGKTIKSLRSDRGGEYMSQEFLDHLKDHGIIAHRTPPYTPQHNGVSERRNRTLLDMVRSMMSQTTLPKSFWDYALETAARILNMVPTKKVEKTPYEVWHGQAPKLSYLKVWGCEALVKRDNSYQSLTTMNVEMQSMKDNEVWILVELPPNGKTVGSKWLFKKKTDMDRAVHTYKARLVAKEAILKPQGLIKRNLLSFADIRAIRSLISHNPRTMTIRILANGSKTGLPQWISHEEEYMSNLKHSQCHKMVNPTLEKGCQERDLGEAAYILGIKIYRDRSRWLIGLCQSAYIEKILKRFHMENSKRGSIPMQDKLRLSKSQAVSCPRPDDIALRSENITRPNSKQKPGDLHWTTVKNIA
ncbi:retrotransposon protein, putative, ty1-copia subclass [Tanacetum coccineum]